ncbi:hypothetical protein ESZ50_00375 [Weissella muntiaci]|uniref:Uncharacterized protein n=1 Tax=Weissella muntiaci TaxID=2508881 RepID=A0A6C2CBP3_9LACO|nr:hypothetical protein [Weissella muntiaci]TYC51022.1 hypothetical protein ESZ50_00375 [Weissella muntiaci]
MRSLEAIGILFTIIGNSCGLLIIFVPFGFTKQGANINLGLFITMALALVIATFLFSQAVINIKRQNYIE